jgi:hypothetical protein
MPDGEARRSRLSLQLTPYVSRTPEFHLNHPWHSLLLSGALSPPSTMSASVKSANDEKTTATRIDVAEAENLNNRSDESYLELLGYKNEFRRDFSFVGLFSLVSSELAVLPGVAGTIW